MKKTVFIALSLAIVSFAVLPLFAEKKQWKGNDERGGAYGKNMRNPFMHLNMMQDKLGLTNNQVDKMYKIKKDYMDKFYQDRNNADKIKELKAKRRGEMDSVLTPEQKAKWDGFKKDKEKHGNKAEHGPKKDGQGHHMGMMQKSLNLSNDQNDKIFKIRKDYMDKFYQNRNNEDKIEELHTKLAGEIQNVLTPQQKTKLDELKRNRQKRDDKKDYKNKK